MTGSRHCLYTGSRHCLYTCRRPIVVIMCCAYLWTAYLHPPAAAQRHRQGGAAHANGAAAPSMALLEETTASLPRDECMEAAKSACDSSYRVTGLERPFNSLSKVYMVDPGGTYAGEQFVDYSATVTVHRHAQDKECRCVGDGFPARHDVFMQSEQLREGRGDHSTPLASHLPSPV